MAIHGKSGSLTLTNLAEIKVTDFSLTHEKTTVDSTGYGSGDWEEIMFGRSRGEVTIRGQILSGALSGIVVNAPGNSATATLSATTGDVLVASFLVTAANPSFPANDAWEVEVRGHITDLSTS